MRYLDRAYPWLLLLPVLLPVLIWGDIIYPYLVPKTLAFYAVSILTTAVFLLRVVYGRTFFWSRLKRWEAWVPGLLLVLAYVASIVGVDFYRSFWSLFVRGDGLLMLTCAVVDFYLILLYVDEVFFERLIRAVAVVGSFVAVYGIVEWLAGGGRIGSLLGNAAFFAGYLGISFFATVAAVKSLPTVWRRAAIVGAILQVIAILLSATRGTILALVAAFVALVIFRAWWSEEQKCRRRAKVVLAVIVLLSGGFVIFHSELAQVPITPIARIASISTSDPDVASRLFIWENMMGEIMQRPVLGVGAEHVSTLFDNFYDPTKIAEEWFDRSHNAFLDYAVQYGVAGVLLYVVLIASFLSAALRFIRRGDRRLAGIAALLAVTYAVQNFFVFDTVSSFWTLLALLAAMFSVSGTDHVREQIMIPTFVRPVGWVVAVALLIAIVPVSVYPAVAAYDLAQAYHYQVTDVPEEINYLSHGIALGTYGNLEYGYEVYGMYVGNQRPILTGTELVNAYQVALSILTLNFNRFTYDARTALYLAHVLSLAPEGVTVDRSLLSGALERAIRLSPKRAQPWYILVNLSLSQGNEYPPQSKERAAGYAAAEDLLNRYLVLVPTLAEPHFVLAELLFASGDTSGAAQEASKGRESYTSNLETARRAVRYYENVKDWNEAEFFLREVVRLAPADHASRYDLAKVMYLGGDPAAAEMIVEELRTIDPSILETDQNFLSAITAYEQTTR